jgi:A/G-specific adenine glycosylase
LATASRADVIRAWQGLGYNLRAVRLHEIARQAVERFGGQLPASLTELLSLKGIGHYTAGAVACFAFEQPVAIVDTNVRRVLGRVFLGEPLLGPARERQARGLAEEAVPRQEAYAWNQALMDLGATICTAVRPACLVCPLLAECRAAPAMGAWPEERKRLVRESRATYDTDARQRSDAQRFYRGRVVDALRGLRPGEELGLEALGPQVKADFAPADLPWLSTLVRKLAGDGLVVLSERSTLRLPE